MLIDLLFALLFILPIVIIVIVSIGLIIMDLILVFREDTFAKYKRNIKLLIKLLDNKGYCPAQIVNILNLYD
jgi:hypothetical protein